MGDVVTELAMTAVFRDGGDPLPDDALGRPHSRFDAGKRHAVVGFDLTFTAPKSVSVLWVWLITRRASSAMTRTGQRWRHRWRSSSNASSARASAALGGTSAWLHLHLSVRCHSLIECRSSRTWAPNTVVPVMRVTPSQVIDPSMSPKCSSWVSRGGG